MKTLPNIKPISDLRNYSDVLNEVKEDSPVYLTGNGRGKFAIIKLTELDKLRSIIRLLSKLEEGDKTAKEKGWFSAGDVEARL